MTASRPRIGFLGTGWIGRHRMRAMLATEAVEAAAVVDPSDECASEAAALAPGAERLPSLEAMLERRLDGVVIASPSALHAAQSMAALEAGAAVFCQKPLGRSAAETRAVVDAARKTDRLLGVDFSYRHTAAMRAIRPLVQNGDLGRVFAADLVFHNAYGPDKDWFYDRSRSGGGCVMDLGIHLVDLLLDTLGWPEVIEVDAALYSGGEPLTPGDKRVEDFALATLRLEGGCTARLACSWNASVGRDAVIEAAFHGTAAGAALRNVEGSFYDFTAERFDGTGARQLAGYSDEWGGRAASGWAERLASGARFDPDADRLVRVAEAIDRIYECGFGNARRNRK